MAGALCGAETMIIAAMVLPKRFPAIITDDLTFSKAKTTEKSLVKEKVPQKRDWIFVPSILQKFRAPLTATVNIQLP